ncbi:MAG: helix-hairpin-helix domain-containing protein [Ruminococcus sp.]|nr:helix-hairpin-helix domain-containing protein [Ruminococcus sp.]
MNERKYRILILVIGSIMVLSIFLPKLLRAERSERVLNVTLTGGEEITSVSSKNSEIKHTRVNTTAVKIVTTKTTTTTSSKIDKKEETTEFLFLDINSASAEELEKLKGIGPVLAKAIVDYRSENGGFRNIDELLLVSGIGESIFFDIRSHVFVVDPVWPDEEGDEQTNLSEENTEISDAESFETDEDSGYEEPETEPTSEIFPVDINTADRDTILLIPGMSEESADEIIQVREKIGGFANEYELLLVKSLSRSYIAEISELLEFTDISQN